MITASYDKSAARATLSFPSAVSSTTVAEIQDEVRTIFATETFRQGDWQELHLDLGETSLVDSMGLNLFFDLVRSTERMPYELTATIGKRVVYMTFLNVRLERKIKIKQVGPLYR